MNRRDALKLGALSSGALGVSTLMGFSSQKQDYIEQINNGHIKIELEEMEIFIFSDGHVFLENPQPIFAPEITSSKFNAELETLFLKQNELNLSLNVMLIKTKNKIILIDSGSGNHFNENEGWLLKNLKSADITADKVTDVFITHAHRDHIGGLVTKEGEIVYPNAQYHLSKLEYTFWMSDKPDFSKSKIDNSKIESSVNFTKKILKAIKEKISFFSQGDSLFNFLHTELAEGHTPGHIIFTISSGTKSIKSIVDIVHSTFLIGKPEWGTQWDVDFEKGIETRKRVLNDCFINKQLIMSSHLPWPGLGYIGKKQDYYWVPLSYATPNEINL